MRIGILTSGGDCPGINATIRGVCKTAINYYGMEVVGIHSGFQGLLTKDVESITDKSLSGLLNLGGTMLGTSREKPFKKGGVVSDVDKPSLILQNIHEIGLDCVVCIGGNGTQKTAAKFAAMGVNIVSVPKTIDNDIWGTDISFGFDSAVSIATDAIDRLHSTASSHKRVMVIEVMGHKAGWIALYSGMAGGGDVILNVSHFMKKIAVDDCLFTTYKKDLLKMLSLTESMTQNAIFAFTCEDIQLAKETIETDDQVDELHHFIGQHLPTQCFDKILSQQEVTDALCINSMAYNIERIGDNATNIAEAAIYLIEGKNIKHWPKPDEDLLLAGSEG